jgi:hypothetical protein
MVDQRYSFEQTVEGGAGVPSCGAWRCLAPGFFWGQVDCETIFVNFLVASIVYTYNG